jgi:ferric-dicitrate binding protein FerR (iron transport regulator)
VLATAVGEHTSWDMPDGSLITLNTDSEVKIEYREDGRDAFLLRGEAHFDVASEPGRTFHVYVANGVVEAVGTAFNVRLRDERQVEVAVTEGVVQVRQAAAEAATLAQLPRAERQRVEDAAGDARGGVIETRLSSGEVAVFSRNELDDALQVLDRITTQLGVLGEQLTQG